jgi:hypothetical protein
MVFGGIHLPLLRISLQYLLGVQRDDLLKTKSNDIRSATDKPLMGSVVIGLHQLRII